MLPLIALISGLLSGIFGSLVGIWLAHLAWSRRKP